MSVHDQALDDGVRQLRAAVVRADGHAAVAALAVLDEASDLLQLRGDAVLVVLARRIAGAREVASRCIAGLLDRAWDGDVVLADELAAAVSETETAGLRGIAVDLEELASALEGDPLLGGGRLDLVTGEVWPDPAYGDSWDEDEIVDDDRWLHFDCEGSSAGYADMCDFIETVADDRLAGRLEVAIRGRGAFRRFRDALFEDEAARIRFFAFSEERMRGRARAWLAARGLRSDPLLVAARVGSDGCA